MHILLTDILTCPSCGPAFGLIVLADALDDRRVREGRLGCANCRRSYAITGEIADLRHPSSPPIPTHGERAQDDHDRAFRAAALMGVQAAARTVAVLEPSGTHAAAIAEALPEVHVLGAIAGDPNAAATAGSRGTLSRLRTSRNLPFRSASLHGVAAVDLQPEPILAEISRVMVPGSRLVVDPARPDLAEALRGAGFTVLLEQDAIMVAAAQDPR